MRILALDPGATTGWAMFKKPNNRDGYTSGQVEQDKVWALLESSKLRVNPNQNRDEPLFLASAPVDLTIVYESFQYRQLPKANLSPVEVIGVIKEWAAQNDVRLEPQTPAEGKFYFHNDRLKKMGLYKTAQPHANDAMRHLLYYLGFGKGITLGEEVVTRR